MLLASTLLKKTIRHAPRLLTTPLRLLPNSLQHKPIELAFNEIFSQLIEDGEFDFLQGKWLRLNISDLGLSWHIGYDGKQLCVRAARGNADVSFSGNLQDLILLASRRVDPDSLFFNRQLMIEGDTELGLTIRNLIDSFDMDELPKLAHWAIRRAGDVALSFGH